MERRISLKKIKEKRDSREHKAHFVGPSFDIIPLRLGNITTKQRMANHGEEHGHHPTQPHSLRFDGWGMLRMAKQGSLKVKAEVEVFDSMPLRVIRGKMAQSTEHIACGTGHRARSQEPGIDECITSGHFC